MATDLLTHLKCWIRDRACTARCGALSRQGWCV